jgi:hypothetical protein
MGKSELQRIGSTLNQLSASSITSAGRSASSRQECSFKIWSAAAVQQQQVLTETVQPFPAQVSSVLPALPKFKLPSFSSHRHVDNPAFSTELLKTITDRVTAWQSELQQVLEQIQAIYVEGPIIDGWLESPLQKAADDTTRLQQVEADRLVDYVQDIYQTQDIPITPSSGQNYRLCGLDANGKLWSRPCPAEQLPHVSLAIGRYQKLRQLLGRKQYLETRLSQTANMLLVVHDQLETSL